MKTTKSDLLYNEQVKKYIPALHHVGGFDFEKPTQSTIYNGTFTALKLRKAATAAGISEESPLICLSWWGKHPDAVKAFGISANNEPFFSLDTQTTPWNICQLPDYFNKSDWNEYRLGKWGAGDDLITLILAQAPEYITKVSDQRTRIIAPGEMPGGRYKNIDVTEGIYNGIRYVSQFDAINEQGQKCHYSRYGRIIWGTPTPEALSDVIDKSGYYIKGKRDDLKSRAKALKAENDKNKANDYDCSPIIAVLKRLLEDAITETKKAYQKASTREEWQAVNDINDRWHGVPELMRIVESFEAAANEKNFTSVERIENRYSKIEEEIHNYIAKLRDI